ncbi:MAG: potassium channel protein [Deltaproteobacteria bacterium]|nr:potassium channel protein [Deltaproteobacteria bacterium]
MITNKKRKPAHQSRPVTQIIRGAILLVLILLAGTAGYVILEGWPVLDALYMTIITITTVGFGEVNVVSSGGRIFTICIIFMGMGTIAYSLGMVAQLMVETQVKTVLGRRKLGRKLRSIKNHYIVCGFGRIGKIIARGLKAHGVPVVVIDQSLDSKEILEEENIPHIIGDATSDDNLIEAGIERAKGLVTVVLSDADNLFITMTARGLNPKLFIVSRADDDATEKKLMRAGASKVVLPYLIGGMRMVHTILRPAVMDFIDFTMHKSNIELKLEELLVGERSRLSGVSLINSGIRKEMNVIIVAIRKQGGEMVFNPSSETVIEAGDTLIALGPVKDLDRLSDILRH